jgi:hypothetical protein
MVKIRGRTSSNPISKDGDPHKQQHASTSSKQNINYRFSEEDERRLMEAKTRLSKRGKILQSKSVRKSPYMATSRLAMGIGKKRIRSKLIENYFQTNRNEIEVSARLTTNNTISE